MLIAVFVPCSEVEESLPVSSRSTRDDMSEVLIQEGDVEAKNIFPSLFIIGEESEFEKFVQCASKFWGKRSWRGIRMIGKAICSDGFSDGLNLPACRLLRIKHSTP